MGAQGIVVAPSGARLEAGRRLAAGIGFGLAAVAMWAAYLAFARAGVSGGLGPVDFIVLRYGVAGVIMTPFLLRAGLRDLGGVGWGRGAVLAFAAGPLFILLGVSGYLFAPLAVGVVAQPAAVMLFSAPLAWLVLKVRPTASTLVAIPIILVGLAAMLFASAPATGPQVLIGTSLFAGAGALWAFFTVLLKRWSVSAMAATAAVSVLSGAIAIPFYFATYGLERLAALPIRTLITQIIVQGVFSGVLAVVAYSRAVSLLGPQRAALFTALVPGSALLLGVPVTGEIPSALQIAGAAIVMGGLTASLLLPVPASK